jgi:predicted O-linked N-acetylglucosamine transferase (SPINDLY family)
VLGARGIDDARVQFAPYAPNPVEAARVYAEVDVGLDPFPYNGTTTTCEALWMGVPVVTLRGGAHRARVGASLLERVGCRDLVVESIDDYVRTATALATDRPRLAALRAGLRLRMATSPVTNAALITRDVEDAYREMWRIWCRARAAA